MRRAEHEAMQRERGERIHSTVEGAFDAIEWLIVKTLKWGAILAFVAYAAFMT